jgi:glycerol-3-phosphate cytidylyltransferase
VIVLTMGTFDLFHAGHVAFLRHCRDLAGPLGQVFVGLNTDAFAESYKRRPTIDYAGREAVLRACRFVDDVVPNDQPGGSAKALVAAIAPHIVAATMDYHPSTGKDWFVQIGIPAEWFRERSIAIEWIPYSDGVSSTEIRSRL